MWPATGAGRTRRESAPPGDALLDLDHIPSPHLQGDQDANRRLTQGQVLLDASLLAPRLARSRPAAPAS